MVDGNCSVSPARLSRSVQLGLRRSGTSIVLPDDNPIIDRMRSGSCACTLAAMTRGAEIRFLHFAGRRVAYAVTGDGPPLVAPAWWVSHLELDWEDQAFRGLWESISAGYTAVRYDRLGVGMSDRDLRDEDLTLDSEVALLGAVLDELALQKVVLVTGSSGGCAAVAFAARFPERVDRLLLYGAYADGSSIASPELRDAIIATVRSHWGLGSRLLADLFLGDAGRAEQERLARHQRAAASPQTAAALLELFYRNDVRAELARVRADSGRAPSWRPRDPLPPRPRAGGGDPQGDADPAHGDRSFPVGRRYAVGGARDALGAGTRRSGP